ncbi:MAG: 3'(2'),5'-bisphosphate nucleotidase CysQ [Blastocatellia bacterium]|nr:3'(2'),5'-bisphosphate nucleotidase CysQ [Blastocatellia bacterium]
MYERELESAVALAKVAGKAILKHYETDLVVEDKIGIDSFSEPVTAADREASSMIVAGLSKMFPGDGILSEEEDDQIAIRLGSERVWIIDPIDGTAGFIKKDGDFAVQIGLAVEGIPVVGVVLLPYHETLYYAARGYGSYAENVGAARRKLSVTGETDLTRMNLAVSRNHRSEKMERIVGDIGFRKAVPRGSVGLKVGLITEQECDVYVHLSPRTKMWDTCGPEVILEEAGGRLTDLWGQRYRYDIEDVQNWGGIVASNGVAHDKIICELRPLLNEFGRHRILKTKAGSGQN